MRGALARRSSAASGFFFWGMMLDPRGEGVGQLDEAELLARPQDDLGAQPREVRGARGGRAQEVQDEVAVGDGVQRVGGDPGEAELARRPSRGRCRS